MMDAQAKTIAQLQKIDDGADPKRTNKLLDKIDDFKIDSDSAVEIDVGCDDLYLSVDTDLKQVEAKFDQDGKLIVQLREKYRCMGFEGVAKVIVRASTGITRDDDEFNEVIK